MQLRLASIALLTAISLVAVAPARADTITDGDFSNGLTGWTLGGDQSYISYGQAQGQFTGQNGAPLGDAAYLGTSVGEGTLTQTFATDIGQTYNLSFVLEADDGTAAPDYLTTFINGLSIGALSVANIGQTDWALYTGTFTATGTSTSLEFAFRNDPSYFELTDVAIPEPGSLSILLAGLGGMIYFLRQRRTLAA